MSTLLPPYDFSKCIYFLINEALMNSFPYISFELYKYFFGVSFEILVLKTSPANFINLSLSYDDNKNCLEHYIRHLLYKLRNFQLSHFKNI